MPPQENRGDARLAGCRIEPPPGLQAQRARLAQNRGQRPRMKRLLHHAQNLGILPAIDPDDASRIEAEARQPRRIAIGPARRPQHMSLLLTQNAGRHRCGKRGHRGRKFALQSIRPEFMKRAELQAATRKRRIQPPIRKGQNAAAFLRFQMMALKGADLHP